jgi:4-alpha-glucanotransferase
MNYPSRAQGNWQWRFTPAMLTGEISGRLRELALMYGRCPPEPEVPSDAPQERGRQQH